MAISDPIIAFDMGGTRIRIALVDNQGRVIARAEQPTRSEAGPEAVADRIVETARELLAKGGHKRAGGIGAAVAGPIDADGVLYDPPNLIGWKTVRFKELLEQRFDAPVAIGNDANLACLGERQFGSAKGVDDVIFMTVSTGVGGGVISGGRTVTGVRGLGAEVGHIIIDLRGPTGRCGHQGCLESHVSGTAIAARARSAVKGGRQSALAIGVLDEVGAADVFHAAARGDPLCADLVRSVGMELGVGIVSLVHIFNPKMFILGGGVMQNWNALESQVRRTIGELTFPEFQGSLEIRLAALGDDVGVIGAAALVLGVQGS